MLLSSLLFLLYTTYIYILLYIILYIILYIYIGSGDVWWTRTCQTSGRLQPLKGSERYQISESPSVGLIPQNQAYKTCAEKISFIAVRFSPSMSCENLDNAKPPETNFQPYQPTCLVLYPFSGWICWTFTIVVDELHNVTPWFHPNEFVWSIPKSFNLESFIILFPVFRSPFEAQFVAKAQNLGDPNLLPVKSCQIHEGRTSLV